MAASVFQIDQIPVSEVARPAGDASCDPFDSLIAAGQRLIREDVEALPVLAHDGTGRPVGWLTTRSFTSAVARDPEGLPALQVRSGLSPAPSSCRPEDSLALARMQSVGSKRLPVVDEAGRLCGVLTLEDIAARIAADYVGGATELERAICETLAVQGGGGRCGISTSKT